MIIISGGFRIEFREQIKEFCFKNNLEISYRQSLGDYDYYNIHGETYHINNLLKYNEQLQQERKNKSFWFKFKKIIYGK